MPDIDRPPGEAVEGTASRSAPPPRPPAPAFITAAVAGRGSAHAHLTTPALITGAVTGARSAAHVTLTTPQALASGLAFGGTLEIQVIHHVSAEEEIRISVPADAARATSDDYTIVFVPIQVAIGVFTVLAVCADAVTGVVFAVAAFLITRIAMRDDEFSKLVARAARHLRGE